MIRRMAWVMVIVNFLFGCATAPITPVRKGEALAIKVTTTAKTSDIVDISNESLGSSASKGVGAGALAGGMLGLTCGPWFFVCSPVYGAMGAIGGMVAGAGIGATGALEERKADKLRERLARAQQSRPLRTELEKNLADRAQKHWRLHPDPAPTLLAVEIQDLLLSSTRDEQINCSIRVLVSVQRDAAKDSPTTEQKMYEYVAPTSNLSIWLDESNDFIDTLLTSASQQIAAQIVSDLALD